VAGQDAAFGKARAQAVRDGADISRVVNAGRRAGMSETYPRIQTLYRVASDRAEAVGLLRRFGYLL
jgi:hypothetical protein